MKLFRKILNYPVGIWGKGSVSSLCNDQAVFAMDKMWKMIEWEYSSFLRDCKRNPFESMWITNPEKHDRFQVRNVARTTSYINLLCSLEDIVKCCYLETIKIGNHFFSKKFKVPQRDIEELDKEIKLPRGYRRKLTAHTAYGAPKDDDPDENFSMRLTSLLYMQGGGFSRKDSRSFSFGGMQISVKGETAELFKQRFGIYAYHPTLKAHFRKWLELFIQMLQFFREQCPIENKGKKLATHPNQLRELS